MFKLIAIGSGFIIGLFGLVVVGIMWWLCWVIKA